MEQDRPNEVQNALTEAVRVQHLRKLFRQSRKAAASSTSLAAAGSSVTRGVRPHETGPQIQSISNRQNAHFNYKTAARDQAAAPQGARPNHRDSESLDSFAGDPQHDGGDSSSLRNRMTESTDMEPYDYRDCDTTGSWLGAASVEVLRQQWQTRQRRRMLTNMEQKSTPTAPLLRQQQQLVESAGRNEDTRESNWYEEVRTAVRSTEGGSVFMAAPATSYIPTSPRTLYGYAERGVPPSASHYSRFRQSTHDQGRGVPRSAIIPDNTNDDSAPAPYLFAVSNPAEAAANTAAAVAAAAANLSTLLATASMAFGSRPAAPAPAPGRQKPLPQRSQSRKATYAPEPGPAFERRLPVFRNVTNTGAIERRARPRPAATAALVSSGPAITTAAVSPVSGIFAVPTTAASSGEYGHGYGIDEGREGHIGVGSSRRRRCSMGSPESARASGRRRTAPWLKESSSAAGGVVHRGPLVYDMRDQMDMYMPDVRTFRLRPASVVMGCSKRGLDEPSKTLDDRPPLEVRDTLLRKRIPSASFIAPVYATGLGSPRASCRRGSDRAPEVEVAVENEKTGGRGVRGAAQDDLRRQSAQQDRSRSGSRGRSLRQRTTGGGGPGSGGDCDVSGGDERGRPRTQATAEPMRSVPSAMFSRAARFPQPDLRGVRLTAEESAGRDSGAEGAKEDGDKAIKGRSLRPRRRTWSEVALSRSGGGHDSGSGVEFVAEGGGGRGKAATAASASTAPLQLDVAYRAVLPRVKSVVISATSRRIEWIPNSSTAATEQQQQRFGTMRRSPSQPRRPAAARDRDQVPEPEEHAGGDDKDCDVVTSASRATRSPPEVQHGRMRRWQSNEAQRSGRTARGSAGSNGLNLELEDVRDVDRKRRHRSATSANLRARTEGSGPVKDDEDTQGDVTDGKEETQAFRMGEGFAGQGAEQAAGGDGLTSRHDRRDPPPPLEPMATLENLAAAVASVRPRVLAVRFAHRSVAEDMRRELQVRRVRQLQKAHQLQEQLRNQTVEQLWPSTAAQLRRRERLQALSRRRHGMDAASIQYSSSGDMQLLQQGEAEALQTRPQGASMVSPERPQQLPTREALAEGPMMLPVETTRMAAAAGAESGAIAPGPFDSITRASSPARGATLSPGRVPHFMAATRLTLHNLVVPPAGTALVAGAAADAKAVANSVPTAAGLLSELQPQSVSLQTASGPLADPWVSLPVILNPSYALIGKRAPSISFSPLRQTTQLQPRYSREPGPGHYDLDVADNAISRLVRSPAAVFGTARRDLNDSPTRHGSSITNGAAATAEVAWLERDPAAARDCTRRRVPAALILPEAAVISAPQASSAAEGDEGGVPPMLFDVKFILVEPRVKGTPMMRKPPQLPAIQVSDEDGQLLERVADPWAIDVATRPRRPAWGFPSLGHEYLAQSPVYRHLLDLEPVYDMVQRRVTGAPDFLRTPARNDGETERLRRMRRQPGIGEYNVEMAWFYLCRRAPQVLMRLAEPRWRAEPASRTRDGERDDDAVARQQEQALLELSQALDYIRPRPPAWTFAPVVRVVGRDAADPRVCGVGFGPLLSFDVSLVLVRRRLPGTLPFGVGPPRRGALQDSRALATVRHLAPGYYEAEQAWWAAQPRPRTVDFARGIGHLLNDGELPSPNDGGDLPYGTRLVLDAAAAKDATLSRRDRGAARALALAPGRAEALPADPAYDARTTHLPLPDADLDLPIRQRVRNVVLEGTPGHLPPVSEPSAAEALRGPGAYFPAGAEQALAIAGTTARVVDFGRGPERDLLGRDKLDTKEVMEGNRLVLSPHTALDFVRARPRAALIQPEHAADDAFYDLAYLNAVYDVGPGLELLLRQAPRQLDFGTRPARDLPLAWPAGIDPVKTPYSRAVGWLGPEDVALTQLAGFRRAPGAIDFALTRARTPLVKDGDGQRLLDLDPDAARDRLRRQPPRPPNLALGRGHAETRDEGVDRDLTAWLSYQPRLDAVRQHLVPPLALPLSRQIGREQAVKADPRIGDNAVGDLDGGVYRVRHRLVWRSAPAIDFGRGVGSEARTGLAPGALPADSDAGNVLLLDPRLPTGWRPPRHSDTSPTRQPFGRGEGRWERPGADPAYRFLSAVGDEGPALYLRYSADDLALLRWRATVANAPAAAWGWMTSRRSAQVMQPDPARAPRPRLPSPAVSKVAIQLLHHLPPPSSDLEVIKNNPANDPRVVAIRRRDRVLQKMLDKIKAQRAALVDI